MSKTLLQQKALAVMVVAPDALDSACFAEEAPPTKVALKADAKLAARCVAGEVAAWEQIYAQCHEPLSDAIRHMLGGGSCDATLVDEIVARVWYALVANDGERLARYSPKRGARLITYMRAMARDELSRHYRSEFRRRRRETLSARHSPQVTESGEETSSPVIAEFLETLTPAERGFCREVLFADDPEEEQPEDGQDERSQASIWQLTHRSYKKLMHFLGR